MSDKLQILCRDKEITPGATIRKSRIVQLQSSREVDQLRNTLKEDDQGKESVQ